MRSAPHNAEMNERQGPSSVSSRAPAPRGILVELCRSRPAAPISDFEAALDAGASPSDPWDGFAPLMAAARAARADVARLLLRAGASASAGLEIREVLRMGSASLGSALHEAAEAGSDECARLLLGAGADPRALGKLDERPLARAAGVGAHAVLALLLAQPGFLPGDLAHVDREGRDAMMWAARRGCPMSVGLLAGAGSPRWPRDAEDLDAPALAASCSRISACEALGLMLAAGAPVDRLYPGVFGGAPMDLAQRARRWCRADSARLVEQERRRRGAMGEAARIAEVLAPEGAPDPRGSCAARL